MGEGIAQQTKHLIQQHFINVMCVSTLQKILLFLWYKLSPNLLRNYASLVRTFILLAVYTSMDRNEAAETRMSRLQSWNRKR